MTELTNEQIAGVEALHKKATALIDNDTDPNIAALISHVPALCQTVRALRAKHERAIDVLVTAHNDTVANLQSQLGQLTKERDDARSGTQRICTHPNTYPLGTASRRCHDCGLEFLL